MKAIALLVVTAAFAAEPAAKPTLVRAPILEFIKQDPADSLYRAARDAMTRGDYSQAANLFGQVASKYPNASVADEAMYYQAFSMYRLGGKEKLKSARDVLTKLKNKYPDFAKGEPATLRTRICGELARQGDESCAAEVTSAASDLVKVESQASKAERDAARSSRQAGRSTSSANCPNADDDDDERVAALNALLQMDADRAIPILKTVLQRRDECSAGLRRKAVFLVSQKRSAETADLLLGVARNDPDEEVREQAVFWLSQVPDERAVDMLEDILKNSKNEDLQNKALFALSQHRSARGNSILRDFASRDGGPQELREQAIFWLGQRNNSDNNQFLRDLYGRLTNADLKNKVLFSLAQRRNQGNEKWLLDVALNNRETTEVRKQALFWAGQSGVGADELASLYSRLTDQEMKEQVIFVLSQKGNNPAAVDKLMEIAKTDKDADLRKKAIFWLGQSRDPRVQQFLVDLINR
jgi:HEAT repeat protein